MRVLLIWDEGEEIKLYALEGELAELALEAQGKYININDEPGDAVNELNTELEDLTPILSNHDDTVIADISSFDKVVICGFMC